MASNKFFLDANVILRLIIKDNPTLYAKSKDIFLKIARGEVEGYITSLVVHEVTYVSESIYDLPRNKIVIRLKKLLNMVTFMVLDISKDTLLRALDDYKNTRVDFPDCVYKQIALANDMKLLSFDEEFKKLKVERFEEV